MIVNALPTPGSAFLELQMFGKNMLVKRDPGAVYDTPLRVREVFDTIQGEGPFAGEPAVFVRLAGCNLRCWFCDTDFDSVSEVMSAEELTMRVNYERLVPSTRSLVVITGGEPLVQPIGKLVRMLIDAGYRVQIETAGTVWDPNLDPIVNGQDAPLLTVVCSPKTKLVHPRVAAVCKHWKYIIRAGEVDPADGLPNRSTQAPGTPLRLYRPRRDYAQTVWVQPCDDYLPDQVTRDDEKNVANLSEAVNSALTHNYRLTVQLHKLVGLP